MLWGRTWFRLNILKPWVNPIFPWRALQELFSAVPIGLTEVGDSCVGLAVYILNDAHQWLARANVWVIVRLTTTVWVCPYLIELHWAWTQGYVRQQPWQRQMGLVGRPENRKSGEDGFCLKMWMRKFTTHCITALFKQKTLFIIKLQVKRRVLLAHPQ